MFKGKRVRYAFTGTMALVLLFGILAINPTTVRASGYQVCSTVGDEYCMNRDGGGTSNGTSIIVYDKNDPNNDFIFSPLLSYCGNGYVTVNPPCPNFGNTLLNGALDGAAIGEIGRAGKNQCLALGGKLQPCNADGTVQIFTYCYHSTIGCNESLVLNSYWTTHDKGERYVYISDTIGNLVNDGSTLARVLIMLGNPA
jgi:hypothetical protein